MTQVIQSAPWDDDEFEARGARSAEGGDQRGSSDGEAGGAYELGSHFGGRGEGEAQERSRGIEDDLDRIDAPRRRRTRRARTTRNPEPSRRAHFTPQQRFLILDTWLRSKLPAKDFCGLVGVSQHSLYKWKAAFEAEGPAGLANAPKGNRGSRLTDATRRAILMLKNAHPEWGQDRIHQTLLRSEGFAASPGAIGRFLASEGFVVEAAKTKPHPDKVRRFERSRVNELWQTDMFTFVMKREGRRVHMVAFMDDHSRFIVGWGLHASASGALVREVFESSVVNFGAPKEVLTDNGPQYHTWRGKSAFRKLLERRGIRQIVARPRHPQTLGKVERFWQTLWRECVERAIFRGIDDARVRIGHFVDYYNFQRTHSGIDGLVPADRYFAASSEVRANMEQRIASNAKELAREGEERKPFYLTGRVGDANISLHAEGDRVVLMHGDGAREEVDLGATGKRAERAEGETAETSAEAAGAVPPVSRDASPPDSASTKDDSVEHPPGESGLDSAIETLAQKWREEGPASPADPDSDEPSSDEFDDEELES